MENLDKSDGGDNLKLIFKVLKRGDKLEACGAVGGQDLALDIIAQGLLTGQQVAHTF